MIVSKNKFIGILKHHWTGFNIHKDLLRETLDRAGEELNEQDIEKMKISLKNMREEIEKVEKVIDQDVKILEGVK